MTRPCGSAAGTSAAAGDQDGTVATESGSGVGAASGTGCSATGTGCVASGTGCVASGRMMRGGRGGEGRVGAGGCALRRPVGT